jgi:hypothetical protein
MVRAILGLALRSPPQSCVPRPLERDGNGSVPCLVLE